MTWEDVLKRTDLVGGEVETQEAGHVFRGPISAILQDGDAFLIESPWCALLDYGTREWVNWRSPWGFPAVGVNMTVSEPQDAGEGRVSFKLPYIGTCTLFPKGSGVLDPSRVKGLVLDPSPAA